MTHSRSSHRIVDRRHRQRGAALVELAIVMTVICVLIIGIMDFGRIGYSAMAVTGAARAGALYGTQIGKSADFTGMRNTASAAASDIGAITTAASRSCECEFGGSTSVMANCPPTGTCAGTVRIRVSVTASKTFAMARAFPGLPATVNLTRTAVMRAQ
jgi:Flp pilus assembly protein TadG